MRIWDTDTGNLRHTLRGRLVRSVAWSPRDNYLATASKNGTVRIWDTDTGTLQHTLRDDMKEVTSVIWSPDGGHLAAVSDDDVVRIWFITRNHDINMAQALFIYYITKTRQVSVAQDTEFIQSLPSSVIVWIKQNMPKIIKKAKNYHVPQSEEASSSNEKR